MMKTYVKKKLNYVQIHGVISCRVGDCHMMRGLQRPFVIDGVPEGFYSLCEDGILLPKRRKGEKFLVKYTQMHEVEL